MSSDLQKAINQIKHQFELWQLVMILKPEDKYHEIRQSLILKMKDILVPVAPDRLERLDILKKIVKEKTKAEKVYIVYEIYTVELDRDEIGIVGVYLDRKDAEKAAIIAVNNAKEINSGFDIPVDLDEHFRINDKFEAHDEQFHMYVGLEERRLNESRFDEVVVRC